LKRYCKKNGLELFPISAVTGKGIEELKYAMADKVEEIALQAWRDKPQEEPSASAGVVALHRPKPLRQQ
jgi:hypothetical protein